MSFFKRLFKVAESEAHSLADKLEDPIKMTEQGIRDLKKDLGEAMQALAQVKATAIRLKKDGEDAGRLAADYERKAMLVLQKAQQGSLDAAQADSLASQALTQKEQAAERAQSLLTDYQAQSNAANQLQSKINQIKQTVRKYENELVTLKARAKTANSTRKVNQALSQMDSSSTISTLERMREKVKEEESLAEAYGEMLTDDSSIDSALDRALADDRATGDASLLELKAKMGMGSITVDTPEMQALPKS